MCSSDLGQPTWRWRGAKWRVCVLAWPPAPLTGGVRVRAWQSRKRVALIRVKGDSSQGPRARADGTKPLGYGAVCVRNGCALVFEVDLVRNLKTETNSVTELTTERSRSATAQLPLRARGEGARACSGCAERGREKEQRTGLTAGVGSVRRKRTGRRRPDDERSSVQCAAAGRTRRRGRCSRPPAPGSSAKSKHSPSRFHSREEEPPSTSTAPAPSPPTSGQRRVFGFREKVQRREGIQGGRKEKGGGGWGERERG